MFCVIYVHLPSYEYLEEPPAIEIDCKDLNDHECRELKSVLEDNVRRTFNHSQKKKKKKKKKIIHSIYQSTG